MEYLGILYKLNRSFIDIAIEKGKKEEIYKKI
jgi:hypothetical protein